MLFLSNLLFAIGGILLFFFGWAFLHQRSKNAALLSVMCLAAGIYVVGYGLELRATTIEQLSFFLKLQYFGAPFMTVFWFLFSYKFYYHKNASYRLTLLVMIVPVLTLFFNVTNDYHHLLYKSVVYVTNGAYVQLQLTRGVWYYFYSLYSYAMILYGSGLFYNIWRHNEGILKTQSMLMLSGTLWPVIVNILYLLGYSPKGLDLTPFGLLVLIICYALAIFKYGMLELQEIIKTTAFSNIIDGIMVIDAQNRLLDFNKASTQIFQWLSMKNLGIAISNFECGREILSHTQDTFVLHIKCVNSDKDIEFRSTKLTDDGHVLGTVYFCRDVTAQRQMMEKLDALASYDALSQVYNRRKLMEEAEKEAERAVRYYDCLSVLMIDIDRFKTVNDTYGHLAGDEVIYQVALQIKHKIRGTDIVGRYGGEEFVAILSNADKESALRIAENIRRAVEVLTVTYKSNEMHITVSVGVATVINDGLAIDIAAVINQADEAMYRAKENGRNKVSI